MATAGPNYASTAVSDSTLAGNAWSNPSNGTASDNSYATASSNGTQYLKATGFGFSIPTGATIDGIVVEWERKASSSTVKDKAVRIVKGGVVGATDKSAAGDWPTTDTFASYGSSSDLWGETWTAADINAANFGAAIATQSTFVRTASVDAVRITVYYTDVSAITESATATESSDAAATVSDGVTETATASESGDATSALVADITESATATESSDSALGPKQGDITESATAAESSDAVAFSADSVTESASATDTQDASATANASIIETASASESSSASVIVYASASESATATESSDGIAVGQLYREDATGFLVVKSGAGAGYTALAAPTTAAAWRVLDIYGSTSAWHPSDDPPAQESAAPTVDYSNVTGTKPPADATRNQIYIQSGTPSSPVAGDLWFDTANKTWATWTGSLWQVVSDVTAYKTAASIAGQGAFATLNLLTSANIDSYLSDAALGTLKLALNALSVLQGASGLVSTTYNTWVQTSTWNIPAVASASLRGKFLLLLWRQWNDLGTDYTGASAIKRDGATLVDVYDRITTNASGIGKSQTIAWIDSSPPATAAFSYSVHVFQNYNGSAPNINSNFAILELKRS
ncbi:conserved protein of unknown function [Methylococcus capsulatus]|uniref:Uncharacterized protein n=1 Tax=Methylococcus capsulatus TaxID=414 RepID=A0AA35UIS0_METCP|nr:hypothetical protein [Methylococcus capsulatus]CAI8743077.1 conserved protein of unknown function [Methylococcus capsulatus]